MEGEGVIKSCRCHSPATSGTEVVTSLRVPVKKRFSLNGYRYGKNLVFTFLVCIVIFIPDSYMRPS